MSPPNSTPSSLATNKSLIIQNLTEYAQIARDAASSGGWAYPFLGITYFISNPSLFKAVSPVLAKCLTLAVGTTAGLFFFTYLPQVAFCALFSGPLAFLTAAVMVFGEAYAIISVVTRTFLIAGAQDMIFDAVLLRKGHQELVSRGREVRNRNGFNTLGRSITKPLNRFSTAGVLRYIISLPLNAIPAVGTMLFLLYNGVKAGPGYHSRYFQLKRMQSSSQAAFVEKHRGAYTGFGVTSLALGLVPIVGLLFGFTSTVGAAIWASDLEDRETGFSEGTTDKPDT